MFSGAGGNENLVGVTFLGGGDEYENFQLVWGDSPPQYRKPCDMLFLALHGSP